MAKRVLMVDDDPDLVMATQMLLEANGFEVDVAGNGQEAMDVVAGGATFDLFIVDAMMSTLTEGFELVHHLRNRPDTATVPTIMLTSIEEQLGGSFEAGQDAETLMLDAFVRKPVEPEDLLAEINAVLAKRAASE